MIFGRPMRLLAETSLLLNDFFHRRPEVARERSGRDAPEQMVHWWALCHECLAALADVPEGQVLVAEYVPLRLMSVLSDLQLPPADILEELTYWTTNMPTLPMTAAEATEALRLGVATDPVPGYTEDHLLAYLARQHGLAGVLVAVPRPYHEFGGTRFYDPARLMSLLTNGGQAH